MRIQLADHPCPGSDTPLPIISRVVGKPGFDTLSGMILGMDTRWSFYGRSPGEPGIERSPNAERSTQRTATMVAVWVLLFVLDTHDVCFRPGIILGDANAETLGLNTRGE